MPVTQPFKALGVGNGFATCLARVNVEGDANVNPLTLKQAMNVYWLLTEMQCTAKARMIIPHLGISLNRSVQNIPLNTRFEDSPELNAPLKTPEERATYPAWQISDRFYAYEETETQAQSVGIAVQTNSAIQKLYDGDTSDESNFIGYGLKGGGAIGGLGSAGFSLLANTMGYGASSVRIEIGSYMNPYTSSTGGYQFKDGTVTFNIFDENISFGYRMFAREGNPESSTTTETIILDDSNANRGSLSASAKLTDGSVEFFVSVAINGFDFYTF